MVIPPRDRRQPGIIGRVQTLGIDLATDPERTASCLIAWPAAEVGRIELLEAGQGDEALADLIVRADLAGIDAPLGWPEPFAEAIASWSGGAGGRWPGHSPRDLQQRLTDQLLHDRLGRLAAARGIRRPNRPMSVSADRIGATAMRAARLLDHLARDRGLAVDRSGAAPSRVAEVYPAATLLVWGLPSTGYKRANSATRGDLVELLASRLQGHLAIDPAHLEACHRSDDVLDALIACLSAREIQLGRTRTAEGAEERRRARIEGWIHVPDPARDRLDSDAG